LGQRKHLFLRERLQDREPRLRRERLHSRPAAAIKI